jgi:nucleoside-diphosphate-sugar epimerase
MTFHNKTIIVTGGAGFIGSSLTKLLVAQGAKVKVIDNLWRGTLENLKDNNGKYVIDIEKDFLEGDLKDYNFALKVIKEADYVFHLADIVAGINFVFGNEPFIFRENMLINSNTLHACLTNKIANYIYAGTACSYPQHLQMQDEVAVLKESDTYPAHPESAYGWSKLMGEYEAELLLGKTEMNIGLLRFHNVYGPYASYDVKRSQVIPSLIRKVINYPHEDFIIWGSGNQYRDFIYIDDVIAALLLTAEKGMNKGLIQFGSGKGVTIREVAQKIVEVSGKDIPLKFDLSAPEGDRGRVGNCQRANEILGWTPKVSIQEGLKATYQWVLSDMQLKKS